MRPETSSLLSFVQFYEPPNTGKGIEYKKHKTRKGSKNLKLKKISKMSRKKNRNK